MPLELRYSPDGGRVDMVCSDVLTGADLIAANQEIYSPQHLPKLKVQVVDFSAVTDFDVSPDDARRCAVQDKLAASKNRTMVIAIVAPTDLQYGTARIWQGHVFQAGLAARVFRDGDEAELWIAEKLKGRSES